MAEKRYNLGKSEVSGLGKLYERGGEALKRDEIGLENKEYTVFARLAWYGLAKREEEQRWSITQHGINFIEGRVRVQRTAVTVDREFAGLEGVLVSAGDVNSSFYFG
ncbi:hypothetical protein KGG85_gp64 [Streptomyces phage Tefunt]|uniref:Uncharacterized protein n=1 Tax=Streptomyces phage Tefunt TaxID=2041209 RepID=A0A291LIV5_9CAUD|nr:hypothetical protein KGG85_gp64 [Streptomyces phage Tefunt]ATI19004.1 hypothetical protein SEA_TEFUNT_64 [Streptomyces phage Tefunt]AXH70268.1 hypothetical protein SEA_HAIZUM_64 [Streptomyces phage Haizum]QAY15806.1 hypothetical protein SEA_NISHIKIGOI_65 [Streptomyces phage Nishikigoi]